MTITLTDDLRPVPLTDGRRWTREPRITLKARPNDTCELYLNAAARDLLGVGRGRRSTVHVLVSKSRLGIAVADDENGRTLRQDGCIRVKPLYDALMMKPGDSFDVPVVREGNAVVGDMPGTLFTRRMFEERRAKKEVAA